MNSFALPAQPFSDPSDKTGTSALESKARREMIETTGRLFQLLSLPRSSGQIYGLLYLAFEPISMDEIVNALQISKGSASMGLRQLLSWGAVKRVWVPGHRRDYFAAAADLAEWVRASYTDYVKPRLASSEKRLANMAGLLEEDLQSGHLNTAEYTFCADRLNCLSALHKKILTIGPLVEKFF